MDALDRVAQVVLRLGDRVVVEHPGFPPLLDLLDQLGCDVVGVDVDDDGPTVAGLRAALAAGDVRAVFLQPRAQNPAGVARSRRGGRRRSPTCSPARDDDRRRGRPRQRHLGGRARQPRRVAARAHRAHPQLLQEPRPGPAPGRRRAAPATSSPPSPTAACSGPGWSSRILQALLLELLQDPATPEVMADGRGDRTAAGGRWCPTCSRRPASPSAGVDGINLWMRVADERSAVVALATRGIGVAPGEPFLVRPDDDHLRVTVGLARRLRRPRPRSPGTSPTPPAAPRPARPTTAEAFATVSCRSRCGATTSTRRSARSATPGCGST